MTPFKLAFNVSDAESFDAALSKFQPTVTGGDGDRPVVLEFPTELHGLAFDLVSGESNLRLRSERPVDEHGWEDWTELAHDDYEATGQLLPMPSFGVDKEGYLVRNDEIWVRDENASPEVLGLTRELGIQSALGGVGGWTWRAAKLVWRVSGKLGPFDPRVIAAQYAARKGLEWLKESNYRANVALHQFEANQRLLLSALEERSKRVHSKDPVQKAKWLGYYGRLDRIMERPF